MFMALKGSLALQSAIVQILYLYNFCLQDLQEDICFEFVFDVKSLGIPQNLSRRFCTNQLKRKMVAKG